MPIVLRSKAMQTCPVAICDWCKEEITDAGKGIFIWKEYPEHGFIDTKLICDQCEDRHHRTCDDYPYSMELSTFLAFLLSNTGLKGAELHAKVKRLVAFHAQNGGRLAGHASFACPRCEQKPMLFLGPYMFNGGLSLIECLCWGLSSKWTENRGNPERYGEWGTYFLRL